MAGLNKLFCIGGAGGFRKMDGINPIYLQILVGDGNRMWLEPHYFDNTIKPIGKIKVVVPEFPDAKHALSDAIIAFAPKYFENCPSLNKVKEDLKDVKRLDFDLSRDKIPQLWEKLKQEASPIMEKMNIFEANLSRITFVER